MAPVVSLDVGSTGIRAFVFGEDGRYRGGSYRMLRLLHPQAGWVEQDPQELADEAIRVIREALVDTQLTAEQVACLGIATQRGSFLLWRRDTGEPLTNVITWQDLRSEELCRSWNKSWTFLAAQTANAWGYRLTRRPRYLVHSAFSLRTQHVSSRLAHVLSTNPRLHALITDGKVHFGTLDTWLVWKLTGGAVHATDYSNASSTGLYEPFLMGWNRMLLRVLQIPLSILPEIRDTAADYGQTDAALFGAPIRIAAVVGDQQAALFAQGCFRAGDIKVTVGSGTFVCLNTGSRVLASARGVWPLIAWKVGDDLTYMQEGSSSAAGTVLEWARRELRLFSDPGELSQLAVSVGDSAGVVCVPALAGLGAPYNVEGARALLWGMAVGTRREHVVRALLEGLAHPVRELVQIMAEDFDLVDPVSTVAVDGGVANCDFLVQSVADFIGMDVVRPEEPERVTARGAAYLAGLYMGVWKSKEDILRMKSVSATFRPNLSLEERARLVRLWDLAISKSLP